MLAGDLDAGAASRALLAWYDAARRDLPWRRRRDPYAIWLSEIMLQQTRVESVVERYQAFLRRFPDVESLAAASEEEVLGAWAGLGYYRRARMLHRAARQLSAAGEWPRDAAGWRELPGIGDYTAAAIASIGFGERVAVIDGNVERVVSRLLASAEDPRRAAPRRRLRTVATGLLDPERPGDSNQALMELGATVCRPRSPRCDECPLAPWCAARAAGSPESYPPARRRPPEERVRRRVYVARRAHRVLLFQRPADAAQLAGFWELPWLEGDGATPAHDLARKYGGEWRVTAELGRVAHSITRRRFTVEVFAAQREATEVAERGSTGGRWFDPQELEALATSSLVGKALARAATGGATAMRARGGR